MNTEPIKSLEKSRKLSIYDFFLALQNEWIIADLRERIYPKPKDKEHWKFVKEGKRVKIQNISEKNALPTIFDDAEMMDKFKRGIYRDQGYPSFQYKDDKQRATQEYYDMMYFFNKGVDIRAEINGEILVCKITYHKPYESVLKVKHPVTGDIIPLEVKKCTRIM